MSLCVVRWVRVPLDSATLCGGCAVVSAAAGGFLSARQRRFVPSFLPIDGWMDGLPPSQCHSHSHSHLHCSALTDMESLVQKASNLISSFPVDSSVVYHKDIESPALQQFYRCSLPLFLSLPLTPLSSAALRPSFHCPPNLLADLTWQRVGSRGAERPHAALEPGEGRQDAAHRGAAARGRGRRRGPQSAPQLRAGRRTFCQGRVG